MSRKHRSNLITQKLLFYKSLLHLESFNYCLIKGAFANGVDPDQTPQNAASDQGLHCLH